MTQEERAKWLNKKLDDLGVPEYGRAAAIAKNCDVSHPAAVGWLKGKISRDIPSAISFCNYYKIDLQEWATGEPAPVKMDAQDVLDAVVQARQFERATGELTDEQFKAVVELIVNDNGESQSAANTLTKLATIHNLSDRKNNGANGD